MNPETHRAALAAAARLALSAALPAFAIACSGEIETVTAPVAPAGTNASNGIAASSAATPRENLREAVANGTNEFCVATGSTDSNEDCCRAEVASASFPSDLTWGPNPDLRVDPQTRACCTVLANASLNGAPFPERTKCCGAIGWNGAGACTPWGPPVPPSMKAFHDRRRGKSRRTKTPLFAA
jgi:hypothetical protein